MAAVESEVADHASVLHRRSKPLSAVLPRKIRRYAIADQPHFAAPQLVNPSFSRLAGASAVGSKHWGSVTFAPPDPGTLTWLGGLRLAAVSC